MFEPTDEMVEAAYKAAMEEGHTTASGEFIDVGFLGSMIRAALTAVAPAIRAQAFREAAAVCEQGAAGIEHGLEKLRREGMVYAIANNVAAAHRDCAAAILALAEKETTR